MPNPFIECRRCGNEKSRGGRCTSCGFDDRQPNQLYVEMEYTRSGSQELLTVKGDVGAVSGMLKILQGKSGEEEQN